MSVWATVLDVLTPGSPRHAAVLAALAAETARLDLLAAQRRAGRSLHPLDEIAVCTHELAEGW